MPRLPRGQGWGIVRVLSGRPCWAPRWRTQDEREAQPRSCKSRHRARLLDHRAVAGPARSALRRFELPVTRQQALDRSVCSLEEEHLRRESASHLPYTRLAWAVPRAVGLAVWGDVPLLGLRLPRPRAWTDPLGHERDGHRVCCRPTSPFAEDCETLPRLAQDHRCAWRYVFSRGHGVFTICAAWRHQLTARPHRLCSWCRTLSWAVLESMLRSNPKVTIIE